MKDTVLYKHKCVSVRNHNSTSFGSSYENESQKPKVPSYLHQLRIKNIAINGLLILGSTTFKSFLKGKHENINFSVIMSLLHFFPSKRLSNKLYQGV